MGLRIAAETGKLGLIAGGGDLPITLVKLCQASKRPYMVLRLRGFADPALSAYPGFDVGIAELGRVLELLRQEGCESICFAGNVKRPDFSKLKPDLRGLRALPGAIAAARKGDDALLRFFVREFEKEGFKVEGAQDVGLGLTLPPGPLGALSPSAAHQEDIDLALRVAKVMGDLDIGQGAAAARGVVLAVEAQEGTDALLHRCAGLPAELRGNEHERVGVLAKWPKSIQERRVDLPTIGVATVEGVAAAGLAGIVGEAGATLVMDPEGVIAAADRLGVFVFGLEPNT